MEKILSKDDYFASLTQIAPIYESKHLYARKLRAAARLKKRRGKVLDTPKKQRR